MINLKQQHYAFMELLGLKLDRFVNIHEQLAKIQSQKSLKIFVLKVYSQFASQKLV